MSKKSIIILIVIACLGVIIFYFVTAFLALKTSNNITSQFKDLENKLNRSTDSIDLSHSLRNNLSIETKETIALIDSFKDSLFLKKENINQFLFTNKNAFKLNAKIVSYKSFLKTAYPDKTNEINKLDTIEFKQTPLAAIMSRLIIMKHDIINIENGNIISK